MTKDIFIVVTNKCNLKCTYCYELEKNNQKIIVSNLKKYLKHEILKSLSEFESIRVVFHGGEPFLAFQELKEISKWLWTEFVENKIVCLATTNGTVLSSEIRHWLKNNRKRFFPILSIDGDNNSHNLNRPNSFDKIDCKFFIENWPNLPVKMTVAPNTVEKMYANIQFLQKKGFLVNPSLAKEVDWNLSIHLPVYERELRKLTQHYIDCPELMPNENIALQLETLSPYLKIRHNRACGAGYNVVAYDANANRYPCHAFISDFNRRYDKSEIDSLFKKLSEKPGNELSGKCSNCFIYSVCAPCYGLNFSYRKDMGEFDPKMCEFRKLEVLASAYMHAQMIVNRKKYVMLKGKTKKELFHLIKGIEFIFRNKFFLKKEKFNGSRQEN